jgi:hypothetical protein
VVELKIILFKSLYRWIAGHISLPFLSFSDFLFFFSLIGGFVCLLLLY